MCCNLKRKCEKSTNTYGWWTKYRCTCTFHFKHILFINEWNGLDNLYTHFINTKLIHVFYYDDYTIIWFLSTDPNRIAIVSPRFLHVLVWFVLLILSNYKCSTRLPYQIMCVSFNSNMVGGAGPATSLEHLCWHPVFSSLLLFNR